MNVHILDQETIMVWAVPQTGSIWQTPCWGQRALPLKGVRELCPLKLKVFFQVGVWGSAASFPSGVLGAAPAEIEFGAF